MKPSHRVSFAVLRCFLVTAALSVWRPCSSVLSRACKSSTYGKCWGRWWVVVGDDGKLRGKGCKTLKTLGKVLGMPSFLKEIGEGCESGIFMWVKDVNWGNMVIMSLFSN